MTLLRQADCEHKLDEHESGEHELGEHKPAKSELTVPFRTISVPNINHGVGVDTFQWTRLMFEKSVPDWLTGVWQRLSIERVLPHGKIERDTTTQVFWLQTQSGFADIRVPMGRGEVNGFESMTAQQAIALSKQDGFAGITRSDGHTCEWHHAMDYRPFNGQIDAGSLAWKAGAEGKVLVEVGPDNAYREEWLWIGGGQSSGQSSDQSSGQSATLTLADDSAWKGWFVVCGDFFLYMRDRRQMLPTADSLTALLDRASPHTYADYLDCEISYGRCQQGDQPWEIQLSTLPWKEGTQLWDLNDVSVDEQRQQVVQKVGSGSLVWTVQEWGALEQLINI